MRVDPNEATEKVAEKRVDSDAGVLACATSRGLEAEGEGARTSRFRTSRG